MGSLKASSLKVGQTFTTKKGNKVKVLAVDEDEEKVTVETTIAGNGKKEKSEVPTSTVFEVQEQDDEDEDTPSKPADEDEDEKPSKKSKASDDEDEDAPKKGKAKKAAKPEKKEKKAKRKSSGSARNKLTLAEVKEKLEKKLKTSGGPPKMSARWFLVQQLLKGWRSVEELVTALRKAYPKMPEKRARMFVYQRFYFDGHLLGEKEEGGKSLRKYKG